MQNNYIIVIKYDCFDFFFRLLNAYILKYYKKNIKYYL